MKDEKYIGKKFNRLLVIEELGLNSHNKMVYKCLCDCGNTTNVIGSHLKSGNTKSCGCYMREISLNPKPYKRKYNEFDLSGDFGIGFTIKGEEFYFDLEDYDKIKDFCWRNHRGYIETSIRKNKKSKTIYMHQLVLDTEIPDGCVVDHINRIEEDNRKENLRIVEEYINHRNQSIAKNNSSGYTGVEERENGTWRACIRIFGKRKSKTFKTFEEAVSQRLLWEDEYGFIGEKPE